VDTFSTSDHCTVLFNVIVRPHDSHCAEPTIIYDFENADYIMKALPPSCLTIHFWPIHSLIPMKR